MRSRSRPAPRHCRKTAAAAVASRAVRARQPTGPESSTSPLVYRSHGYTFRSLKAPSSPVSHGSPSGESLITNTYARTHPAPRSVGLLFMDLRAEPPDPNTRWRLGLTLTFHPHQHHNTSWHDPDGGGGPNHDAPSHHHIDTYAHDGHQRRHPRIPAWHTHPHRSRTAHVTLRPRALIPLPHDHGHGKQLLYIEGTYGAPVELFAAAIRTSTWRAAAAAAACGVCSGQKPASWVPGPSPLRKRGTRGLDPGRCPGFPLVLRRRSGGAALAAGQGRYIVW